MNRYESLQSARRVASEMGVDDEQEVETLAGDEVFAAYAHLYGQTSTYAAEVDSTVASDAMKGAAFCAVDDCYEVAHERAEELLGRKLEKGR